jgi:hypothetical protein
MDPCQPIDSSQLSYADYANEVEVPGPVLIGINVDYRDNHTLFEKVHQHLLI